MWFCVRVTQMRWYRVGKQGEKEALKCFGSLFCPSMLSFLFLACHQLFPLSMQTWCSKAKWYEFWFQLIKSSDTSQSYCSSFSYHVPASINVTRLNPITASKGERLTCCVPLVQRHTRCSGLLCFFHTVTLSSVSPFGIPTHTSNYPWRDNTP